MNYKWFEHFINHCRSADLKPWDTFCIWNFLENENPSIKKDDAELREYLTNCLKMAGFNKKDIKSVILYVQLDGKI